MSGIRSYDLGGDQVAAVLAALEGDEAERAKWIDNFRKWIGHRDLKMEILRLTEQWFTDFGRRTGCYKGHHEWETEENQLRDWVWYQMEYVNSLEWQKDENKVGINKYGSSRPLLNPENTQALLDFLTEEIRKRTI